MMGWRLDEMMSSESRRDGRIQDNPLVSSAPRVTRRHRQVFHMFFVPFWPCFVCRICYSFCLDILYFLVVFGTLFEDVWYQNH